MTALDREDIGVVLDEVGLPEYMTARQIGRMMAGIFHPLAAGGVPPAIAAAGAAGG